MFWILISLICGAITWSFAEYVLHRWVGHSKGSQTQFARQHRQHHAQVHYFAPLALKLWRASQVIGLLALATGLVLGLSQGLAFSAGFAFAYLGYEWVHYSLHTYAPHTAYGRWARRHHFFHHFHRPASNHGVTTPLWDVVFGTYEAPQTIQIPRKHLMGWLFEADSSQIKNRFQADYAIRMKHSSTDPQARARAREA